ncbi:conserved protein, unknown function [Hepatocystis sp. ex Piliocolobus tephrosceles]|nr:conserved protein, unknown function [Hepatocystis sp. ex Piliocolobus tephrosceles]
MIGKFFSETYNKVKSKADEVRLHVSIQAIKAKEVFGLVKPTTIEELDVLLNYELNQIDSAEALISTYKKWIYNISQSEKNYCIRYYKASNINNNESEDNNENNNYNSNYNNNNNENNNNENNNNENNNNNDNSVRQNKNTNHSYKYDDEKERSNNTKHLYNYDVGDKNNLVPLKMEHENPFTKINNVNSKNGNTKNNEKKDVNIDTYNSDNHTIKPQIETINMDDNLSTQTINFDNNLWSDNNNDNNKDDTKKMHVSTESSIYEHNNLFQVTEKDQSYISKYNNSVRTNKSTLNEKMDEKLTEKIKINKFNEDNYGYNFKEYFLKSNILEKSISLIIEKREIRLALVGPIEKNDIDNPRTTMLTMFKHCLIGNEKLHKDILFIILTTDKLFDNHKELFLELLSILKYDYLDIYLTNIRKIISSEVVALKSKILTYESHCFNFNKFYDLNNFTPKTTLSSTDLEKDIKLLNSSLNLENFDTNHTTNNEQQNLLDQDKINEKERLFTSSKEYDIQSIQSDERKHTLSGEEKKHTTPDELKNTTPDILKNFTPDVLKNTTPDVLKNTTPDILKNFTPDVLKNTTPDVLKNTTPDVLKNTTPDVLKNTFLKNAENFKKIEEDKIFDTEYMEEHDSNKFIANLKEESDINYMLSNEKELIESNRMQQIKIFASSRLLELHRTVESILLLSKNNREKRKNEIKTKLEELKKIMDVCKKDCEITLTDAEDSKNHLETVYVKETNVRTNNIIKTQEQINVIKKSIEQLVKKKNDLFNEYQAICNQISVKNKELSNVITTLSLYKKEFNEAEGNYLNKLSNTSKAKHMHQERKLYILNLGIISDEISKEYENSTYINTEDIIIKANKIKKPLKQVIKKHLYYLKDKLFLLNVLLKFYVQKIKLQLLEEKTSNVASVIDNDGDGGADSGADNIPTVSTTTDTFNNFNNNDKNEEGYNNAVLVDDKNENKKKNEVINDSCIKSDTVKDHNLSTSNPLNNKLISNDQNSNSKNYDLPKISTEVDYTKYQHINNKKIKLLKYKKCYMKVIEQVSKVWITIQEFYDLNKEHIDDQSDQNKSPAYIIYEQINDMYSYTKNFIIENSKIISAI